MATATKKKTTKAPSVKQLRARKRFAAMAKARAKASRAAKRAAGVKVKAKKRAVVAKRKNAAGTFYGGKFHPYRDGIDPRTGRKSKIPYKPSEVGEKSAYSRKARATVKRGHKAALKGQRSLTAGTSLKQRAISNGRAGQKQLFSMNPSGKVYFDKARKMLRDGSTRAQVAKYLRGIYYGTPARTVMVWVDELKREVSRKNPASVKKGKALFKEFTGRPARKVSQAYAPKGSGAKGTLGAMGKLTKIKVRGRTALNFSATKALLARDGKNQMYVLGKGYKLNLKGKRHNPTGFEDLGVIDAIEYEAVKTHLDGVPTVYVHKMGEEGGVKPHLLVNDEGLAIISGGEYTITSRGIEN